MEDRLKSLIASMDVPENRRDTSDRANVRWLGRNLPIRNSDHGHFDEAMSLIRSILRP